MIVRFKMSIENRIWFVPCYGEYENDIICERDKMLWNNGVENEDCRLFDLLPPKKTRYTRKRGHNLIVLSVLAERF